MVVEVWRRKNLVGKCIAVYLSGGSDSTRQVPATDHPQDGYYSIDVDMYTRVNESCSSREWGSGEAAPCREFVFPSAPVEGFYSRLVTDPVWM